MESKVKFNLSVWALIILLFSIVACNSNTQENGNDESNNEVTTETPEGSSTYSTETPSEVLGGDQGFVYSYTDDPFYDNESPVNTSENTGRNDGNAEKVSMKSNKVNTEKKVPRVRAEPVIYNVSQTDRPPLFSSKCINDDDPSDCSKDELKKWVREYIEYPKNALANKEEGTQYVTFVINQKGVISTITDVDSKGQPCDGCSSTAVDAVAQMPDWQPAMKNGKPVSVVVTLPIRFKVI